jgi:thioredoxin-related protein
MIFLTHFAIVNAENIFQYGRVDFFGGRGVQKEFVQSETKQPLETITDEWAEPIISPSGKVSIHVPPQEVRDFLEKPDPENAKAYLAWNLKRIKKFALAQDLLTKEAKKLDVMKETNSLLEPDSSPSLKRFSNNIKAGASYLFYFMLKGCSVCEREARVIEDIYLNHPEIRIEAFAKGFSDRELEEFRFPARQDNGMSNLFKVNSYPSIAVFNKKKQRYFLSGFMDKDRILGLFR